MEMYSQRDPEWSQDRLGQSSLTVGRWGCTITSICMIHSKFYGRGLFPSEAARTFKYTNQGLIIWSQTNFPGMRFVKRGYWNNAKEIEEYANDPSKGVILEVNKNHWVAVDKFVEGAPVIHDPWDGKEYSSPSKNDYKVTGYALFEKVAPSSDPEWWEDSFSWAREIGLMKKDHGPADPLTWGEFMTVLHRYDKIKS